MGDPDPDPDICSAIKKVGLMILYGRLRDARSQVLIEKTEGAINKKVTFLKSAIYEKSFALFCSFRICQK